MLIILIKFRVGWSRGKCYALDLNGMDGHTSALDGHPPSPRYIPHIAKLSPSSNSSWAEMAIFPINPEQVGRYASLHVGRQVGS